MEKGSLRQNSEPLLDLERQQIGEVSESKRETRGRTNSVSWRHGPPLQEPAWRMIENNTPI